MTTVRDEVSTREVLDDFEIVHLEAVWNIIETTVATVHKLAVAFGAEFRGETSTVLSTDLTQKLESAKHCRRDFLTFYRDHRGMDGIVRKTEMLTDLRGRYLEILRIVGEEIERV